MALYDFNGNEVAGATVPQQWKLNDGDEYDDFIKQLSFVESYYYTSTPSVARKPLNLLHFSDNHGDGVNLGRIISFKERYSEYIQDIICTGDIVKNNYNEGISYWTSKAGSNKILLSLGNHDTVIGSNWTGASEQACNQRYMANSSNWGVSIQSNVCYYYKDYSSQKVRVIVLDAMHWNSTQETWLEGVLNSSFSSNLHVAIFMHFPPKMETSGDWSNTFDTPVAALGWQNDSYCLPVTNSNIPSLVSAFVTGGGNFIGYFCGHTHYHVFRRIYGTQQFAHCVSNSGINDNNGGRDGECAEYRKKGERSQDCFNIISIDTKNRTYTLLHIGGSCDQFGRTMRSLVFDYANGNVLFSR